MSYLLQYLITSPYILPYNTEGTVVYSFFHDQAFPIGSSQKQLLLQCKKKQPIDVVVQKHGHRDINYLIENRLIFNADSLWTQYNIKYAEIEINSNCNYRCEYCPNIHYQKPTYVMPLNMFTHILRELKNLGTIRYLTFHAFNEPTIDPHFHERLQIIKELDFKLELFTNASCLNKIFIMYMKKLHIIYKLKINLPSIDKGNFTRMTGYLGFSQTLKNIHAAIDAGLFIEIIVTVQVRIFMRIIFPSSVISNHII